MKKTSIFTDKQWGKKLAIFSCLAFALTSCNQENENPDLSISEEEAAEVIFNAVDGDSGGILDQSESLGSFSSQIPSQGEEARYASNSFNFTCGTPQTYEWSQEITKTNAQIAWDYLVTWTVNCSMNRIPSQIVFALAGNSSYESPRISSADSNTIQWTFSGIEPTAEQYQLGLTMERIGNQVSYINETKQFSSKLNLSADNLTLEKSETGVILGKVQVSLSGTGSGGETFAYGGTLELKSTQVILTLNSGQVFTKNR